MITEKNVPRLRFMGFNGEFKLLHIRDILKIKNGKSQKNVEVDDGKYPILGTGGVIGHTNSFLCDKESVLIGRKGTINKPFYMNTPFWTVDTLFYSEIKKNNDAKFIYFLFNIIEWLKYNTSTGVPSLTSSNIEGVQVKVPELNEQQKIGFFFAKIDKLIELQTQKLEQLKKLKQGYLQKMFPQDGETTPRLRFAEFSEDWKEGKLGNNITITMGQSPHSNNYTNDATQNVLVQGNADIKAHEISPRIFTKEITKTSHKNEIIITVRAPVGELAINQLDSVVIGRGVAALKADKFYFYLLENINRLGVWKKFSSGSTFDAVNSNDIKSLYISFPCEEEQKKINIFFSKLDLLIKNQGNKINELKKQKKAYLQKMFI